MKLIKETNFDTNEDFYQGYEINQVFESHQGDVFLQYIEFKRGYDYDQDHEFHHVIEFYQEVVLNEVDKIDRSE